MKKNINPNISEKGELWAARISIAVAVNNELVQKSKWKSKIIKEGDVIEIVQPFFGG